MVFEPVLAPGTHIGVRENGEVKKPSHTGTRKHARFTPVMKVVQNNEICFSHTLRHRFLHSVCFCQTKSDVDLKTTC